MTATTLKNTNMKSAERNLQNEDRVELLFVVFELLPAFFPYTAFVTPLKLKSY